MSATEFQKGIPSLVTTGTVGFDWIATRKADL